MLGTGFLHMCIYGQISGTALFCSFKEPPLLLGVLHPNTKLRQAERLFENQLIGPESIADIGAKSELGALPGCLLSEGVGSVGAAAVALCPWTGALHILLSCGHGAWTPDITWEALVPSGSFCWSHLCRLHAVLALGGFQFISVEHFVVLRVLQKEKGQIQILMFSLFIKVK